MRHGRRRYPGPAERTGPAGPARRGLWPWAGRAARHLESHGASRAAAGPARRPEPGGDARARASARPQEAGEAREPRWRPWVIGVALLAAGAAVGWASSSAALRAIMPAAGKAGAQQQPAIRQLPGNLPARAEVHLAPGPASAKPGEQVVLHWQVRNTGEALWNIDSYRFTAAGGQSLPVLSLPRKVAPGEAARVTAVVSAPMVPPADGTWRPAWQLVGPKGPVPGGELTAAVTMPLPDGTPGAEEE